MKTPSKPLSCRASTCDDSSSKILDSFPLSLVGAEVLFPSPEAEGDGVFTVVGAAVGDGVSTGEEVEGEGVGVGGRGGTSGRKEPT